MRVVVNENGAARIALRAEHHHLATRRSRIDQDVRSDLPAVDRFDGLAGEHAAEGSRLEQDEASGPEPWRRLGEVDLGPDGDAAQARQAVTLAAWLRYPPALDVGLLSVGGPGGAGARGGSPPPGTARCR